MKIKSLFYLFAALSFVFLASCDKDDNPAPVVYEVKMTSFGFYVEDNKGIITKDYVNASFKGVFIDIQLPEEVDKSKLVARFTVTENDVVRVGDVVQQSGVTANDYTIPIDFIVTEGTSNVKYTVTIEKAPPYVWTPLPAVTETVRALSMKVSPDGTPYIVYRMDMEKSADQALAVLALNDGNWTSLGQVSPGRAGNYFDIAFNSQNQPAVLYLDYTSTPAQKAFVKSYDGTTWSLVGDAEATSNKVSHSALNYIDDNHLMVMAMYDARDNVLTRREVSVNSFKNGAWNYNATVTGRSSTIPSSLLVSERLGEAVYLGVHNGVKDANSVSVYKYENNAWTTIIDAWSDPDATAGISLRDFDIAVDTEGNVFAALVDGSAEGGTQHRVIKYDVESKKTTTLGNPFIAGSGSGVNFDLAVSPLGVPYLLFKNESGFPAIVSLDNDTQDWTAPKVFESVVADDLSLGFTPEGKGYLVYTNDKVIRSYKYDDPNE